MRRVCNYCGFIAAGLLVLVVLAYLGIKLYLTTGSAHRLASEQLTKMLGSEVVVKELGSGLASTSATIEIPAAPATASAARSNEPLMAGTVRADVSPVGLAAGSEPKHLTVDNARITLRFNEEGDLLDRFPEPQGGGGELPTIRVRNGTIKLVQAGKPNFVATGIDADLTAVGSRLRLTGTVNDPFWTRWKASGEIDTAAGAGSVVIETVAPTHVTPDHLRAVPFVPPETWDVVMVDGTTSCRVTVGRGADEKWSWQVYCDPRGAKLDVKIIDLTTTQTSGEVLVDGPKVTLSNVRGRAAGGELNADAVLDFGPTPSRLTFDVRAKDLTVPELPRGWGFPAQFREGKLFGHAGLEITVQGDRVRYAGSGEGVIRGAKGLGYTGDMNVRLHEMNNTLTFDVTSTSASRRPLIPREFAPLLAVLLQTQTQPPKTEQPAEKSPEKPADRQYVQANLRLKDVDLAELVSQLEVKVPVRLAGRVSLDVSADIPISHPEVLRLYKVKGSLSAPELRIEDLVLRRATAEIEFLNGVLTLNRLAGELQGERGTGTFLGTARYGVEPRTDLTAELKLTAIPLEQVFAAVPDLKGKAAGPVSGAVSLRIPADTLRDVETYVAHGSLTGPSLRVFDRRVEKATFTLGLEKGVASVTDARATIEGLPVAGKGSLTLSGEYPFSASVRTTATDAVAVHRLVPEAELPFELTGKIETTTDVRGTLSPVTYEAGGKAVATGVTVGTAKVEKLLFDWELTERFVSLRDIRADLYEGNIAGAARFPLAEDAEGEFNFAVDRIDSASLTRAVPSLPVRLAGEVTGTVKGTLPATTEGRPRQATANVDLRSDLLRVNGVRVSELVAKVDYTPGFLDYKVSGRAARGTIESEGRYPLRTRPAPPLEGPKDREVPVGFQPPKNGGFLRLNGIDLGALAAELDVPVLAPIRGRLFLNVSYVLDPVTQRPSGTGRLEVADLGWGRSRNAELRSSVRITGDAVDVPDITGRFADGTVRGRFRYNLLHPARSFYILTLDGADANAVLEPFGLAWFGGRFTITTRGNIGRELRGSGTLAFQRAKVTGFDLAELRLPFDWSYVPQSGGRFAVRDMGGQAAGGRVTGETTLAWGNTVQVSGRIRFVDVSMRTLLGQFGSSSGLGSARMNGTFNFTGANVRTVNDVTGQLVAQIGEGPVLDTPVFNRIAEFIVPSPAARGLVSFTGGDLRARLTGGRFNIERLTLTGPRLKMFIEGMIALTGRLDLQVVATTGRIGIDPRVLRAFGLRVPTLGPLPIGLVLQVSNYLSNRTIWLTVTGTVDQPIVRVNVARLLGEEAVRYFLTPALFGSGVASESIFDR